MEQQSEFSRRVFLGGVGVTGVAVLAGGLLAACAPSPSAGSGAGAVRFQSFQGADIVKVWEKQFAAFQTANGVAVKHEYVEAGKQSERLLTLAATNDLPDVAMVSAQWFKALAERGIIEELNSSNLPGLNVEDFWSPLRDCYTYDGKLYGVPTDTDVQMVFVNKDLLAARGLAMPGVDWTWDDYRALAQDMTQGTGGGKIYGASGLGFPELTTISRAYGGQLIDPQTFTTGLTSGGGLRSLEYYEGLNADGTVPPPGSTANVTAGQIGLQTGGPYVAHYALRDAKFSWDMAVVPKADTQVTTAWGSCLVVFKNSKRKEDALKFVSYMMSQEMQVQRATDWAWYPPGKAATETKEFLDPKVLLLTEAQKERISQSMSFAQAPTLVREQSRVQTILADGLATISNGQATAAQAAQSISDGWAPLLTDS